MGITCGAEAFGYLLDARPAPDGARLSLRAPCRDTSPGKLVEVSATKLGSVEKAGDRFHPRFGLFRCLRQAEEVSRKLARMLSEGHSRRETWRQRLRQLSGPGRGRLALRNALAAPLGGCRCFSVVLREYSSGQRRPGRASCAARPARQLLSATAQKLARWARKGIKKYPEIEQPATQKP